MEIKVQITYSVTTPESAEHGDHADHGFYGPGGWKYSIADEDFQARVKRDGRDKAIADMTPEQEVFESVDDAVEFISHAGPFEASVCGESCTLSQVDPSGDRAYYELGEDTRLDYHVEATPAAITEIVRALAG
jgi:hypothetical protein